MVFVSEPTSFSLLQNGTRTVICLQQSATFALQTKKVPSQYPSISHNHSFHQFPLLLYYSLPYGHHQYDTKCTMSQSAVVLCLDSPTIVCHHYSEPSTIFNKGTRFSQIYSTVSSTYIFKFVFLLLQEIFSMIKSHFKTEASFHATVKLFK
jgi:hypothetical protein